ncbi:MAG: cytochrome o ubiquinol oxidase subunit [Gammaproteobacteria bacterium]|jgi:cytochrome o ubiquinol oxidase operon protein cyoD|nr:cytochrome o ubiquinol oxidase subunit [Gammaproteobacteria bacterium]
MAQHFDLDTGAAHGTYKTYIIGFILSVALTLIAFGITGFHLFSPQGSFIAIASLALVQLFIQLVYFLHLNFHSKSRWNLIAFAFTAIVVLILVAGTLWIMYNLYANMGMNAMKMG